MDGGHDATLSTRKDADLELVKVGETRSFGDQTPSNHLQSANEARRKVYRFQESQTTKEFQEDTINVIEARVDSDQEWQHGNEDEFWTYDNNNIHNHSREDKIARARVHP
ncbi:hypothetical protein BST61_g1551 [Cercospora zeina]